MIFLWVEILFAWLLFAAYRFRPDFLAAVTVLPAWIWLAAALPGIWFLRRRRLAGGLFALSWLLFAACHVEEPRSLVRGWIFPVEESSSAPVLRLVTLNCGGGQAAALGDLKPLRPDVIFLQEPPPRADVEHLVRELYGSEGAFLYDLDTAILVRGALDDVRRNGSRLFYSHAAAVLQGADPVHLVSLRLATGHVQVNLWNPDCWDTHYRHRRHQMAQLREITETLPPDAARIVAGDFNAPQGDKIFSLLGPRMSDAFAAAGRGLGNTLLNDRPVLRIDQIWVSDEFAVLQAFARKSSASDHRLVVADVTRQSQ
ncbi:MAG TPA: endonuclease/exonuclease/phosphatase family protein [Kiritimatiellia bacterium]|nr:endonuclease/exonuclease/phosphatase family protein [Kiritimatiellia bacterium]